jgi:hypothetical protein
MSLATVWEVENVFRKTSHVPFNATVKQSPPLSKQVSLDSASHCVIQAMCVATLDPFLTWHLEFLVRYNINILSEYIMLQKPSVVLRQTTPVRMGCG